MAGDLDGNEIAVGRACGRVGRNGDFAAELLLVDRHQAAAPAGDAAENAKRAVLGAVDQLDDASARLVIARPLDAQQRAITDAGGFARPGTARRRDADDGSGAVRFLVPFGRPRQKLAVGVAAGDVGEHHRRQGAAVVQPLAPALNHALVGKLAQHAFELRPIGVLGAEGARYLARADLASMLADEGEKLLARGKMGLFHGPLVGRVLARALM